MYDMVVKTRIIPKKLNDSVVSRERLTSLIKNNLNKNLILVLGPAGFGKTTLVLDFFNQIKKQYAWLYFAPDISSFRNFANYLIHSIKELNNEFGTKTLELLGSMAESGLLENDEKNSISSFMGMFSNEFINTFSEDIYIVIDDMHNSGNAPWITHAFNCLLDDFPENLHIFITSRSTPEFNYPRLAAKRNLLKIDSGELNFNHEETGKLLKDIYSIAYSENELKVLENSIEGWITGLHMILQAYGSNFSFYLAKGKIIEENIFIFFAEEIFKTLDVPLKDFLLATSLVDTFNEDLCLSLPGIHKPAGLIKELMKKNIFLESSSGSSEDRSTGTFYSYHNLFKQFLVTKLYEMKTPEEIQDIAAGILSYYINNNDISNSIEFSILSKNFDKTAELIEKYSENLFKDGRYSHLEKWIDSLPDSYLNKNICLKFYKGKLLKQNKAETEKAERIFTELSIAGAKGTLYSALAEIERADLMIESGKPQNAVVILNKLLKDTGDYKIKILTMLSLVKAYFNLDASHYLKIETVLNNALKICEDNQIRTFHTEIYSYFGKFYLNAGEFSKALHYFRNVVQLEKNLFRNLQTFTDIVLLYSWSGEYEKAKEWLEKANLIFSQYPIYIFRRVLMRVTALHTLESGDYESGIEQLIELNSFDAKYHITALSFWYYTLIGEAYIFLGQKEKAKEYYQLAESAMDPADEQQKLEYDLHLAVLKKNEKPDKQVEKVLLASLKYFESLNLVYNKSQVEFYLADFYYKTGNIQTSLKYLKDSLDIAAEKGFNSFLMHDFISKRYLFDMAAANKIQSAFIQNIYEKLIELENLPQRSEESKKRHEKIKNLLYDIKINTFGGIEIFVRGNRVEEDNWSRKKSKLLLVYLLIYNDQKHTKEKIMNIFFGDLSPSSAENIFHQSITNIRNVINPKTEAGDEQLSAKGKKAKLEKRRKFALSESFIFYEDKILRIAPGYNYFVDVSKFIKLYNTAKSAGTDEKDKERILKNAAEIYKGEFLPGYYDEWIEELRADLQNRYIEICEDLISILKKFSKYDDVTYYGEKLLKEDKLHTEAYVNLIDAYAKTNNINMAKKKYGQLLKVYNEEYGKEPDKEILKRIEQNFNI